VTQRPPPIPEAGSFLLSGEERTLIQRISCLAALLALAGCGATPAAGLSPASFSLATATFAPGRVLTTGPTVPASTSCRVVDGRADARCTPGALNPDVTQDTIQ
jgi:hypothetical protein